MPSSALFTDLKERVGELAASILPAVKDDLTYTRADYDRVRAYVLLVHAEIEAFLEQRAQDEMVRRMQAWEEARTPSRILMGLLAFHSGEWRHSIRSLAPPANEDKNPTWKERDVGTRLQLCDGQARVHLRANNGIKSEDVLGMFLRLGLLVGDVDADLISELDTLGSDRGMFAHSSVRAVTIQPDPALTLGRITAIVDRLRVFDEEIAAIL